MDSLKSADTNRVSHLGNLDVMTEAVRLSSKRIVRPGDSCQQVISSDHSPEGELEVSHRHDEGSVDDVILEATVLGLVDGISAEQLVQVRDHEKVAFLQNILVSMEGSSFLHFIIVDRLTLSIS